MRERYMDDKNRNTERGVVNEFICSGPLEAEFECEVSVGESLITTEGDDGTTWRLFANIATRKIDIVADTGSNYWIIEAKKDYSTGSFDTALGQALVSAELYREQNGLNKKDVQAAILFGDFPNSQPDTGRGAVVRHLIKYAEELEVEIFFRDQDGDFLQMSNVIG